MVLQLQATDDVYTTCKPFTACPPTLTDGHQCLSPVTGHWTFKSSNDTRQLVAHLIVRKSGSNQEISGQEHRPSCMRTYKSVGVPQATGGPVVYQLHEPTDGLHHTPFRTVSAPHFPSPIPILNRSTLPFQHHSSVTPLSSEPSMLTLYRGGPIASLYPFDAIHQQGRPRLVQRNTWGGDPGQGSVRISSSCHISSSGYPGPVHSEAWAAHPLCDLLLPRSTSENHISTMQRHAWTRFGRSFGQHGGGHFRHGMHFGY